LPAPPFTLPNAPSYLTTPTYDGSGQVVHPDILRFDVEGILPKPYKYIMGITPYPGGNDVYENPMILFSSDGKIWEEGPAEPYNPIDPYPGSGKHNADPNLIYFNGEFWYYWYYREIGVTSYYKLKKSPNGYQFGDLVKAFYRKDDVYQPPHAEILYDPLDKKFKTWWFGSTIRYSESKDGLNWTPWISRPFPMPPGVSSLYHCSVIRLSNGKYWMFQDSEQNQGKWFLDSDNGLDWNPYYDQKVLSPSSAGWDNGTIYKSDQIVENGKIKCWYSACNTSLNWHLGLTEAEVPGLPKDVYSLNIIKKPPAPPTAPEVTDLTWLTGTTLSVIILAEFLRKLHREHKRKT